MANNCPFCEVTEPVINGNLIYTRFDKYPVTEGHMLIVPKRHVATFFDATEEEKAEILKVIDVAKSMLDNRYSPDGYNIGINVGETAGQTVMHLHVHLIPRYKGDVEEPRGGVRGVIPNKQKY